MSTISYVHARVDKAAEQRASEALEAPEIKVPSQSSRVALAEIESGEMEQFNSVDDLMAALHADD